jgi:hypothetical protein
MKLKVNHDSKDYSQVMDDFTNDPVAFDFSMSDLYLGFIKPLKEVYIEMESRVDSSDLTVSIWNGASFNLVSNLEDQTFGLTKSGLVRWPESSAQTLYDLDSTGAKYWIKLSLSNNPANVLINGVNLVLSNDKDFSFVPNMSDYLPENSSSFIAFHQEARNVIVQMLRNSGKKIAKYDGGASSHMIETRQVDQFDLLNIEEFRNASKYLALHLIFDHLSKSNDDVYHFRSLRFYEKFLESYNTNLVSIDTNGNGLNDSNENLEVQFIRIIRE